MAAEIERLSREDLDASILGFEVAFGMSSDEFQRRRRAGEFSFELDYQMWDHLLGCRDMLEDG